MFNTLSEKLFSVKKRYIQNENYRVITVLGITFKIPLKNRIKPVPAKDVCSKAVLMYPEEQFVFTEQRDVLGNLDDNFKEYSYTIPEYYVYEFNNVYYYTDGLEVFVDSKTVVKELTMHEKNIMIGKRYVDCSQAVYIDGTVASVLFKWSENYFHFCIDTLPRLYLILKSGIKIDYFVIDNCLSFQKQYFELFGITEDKIISSSSKKLIYAKQLVIPSYHESYNKCRFFRGTKNIKRSFLPHWTLNFYKEYFGDIKGNNTERIYISRKNAKFRKIENEEEIIAVCKKYDFTVLELEKLSVLEQIQTFRDAKIVVSIHGAGLTNIVHCRSCDVKMLELETEYYKDSSFKFVTQVLGCNYYLLAGKTNDITVHPREEGVYIDPKIFEEVLFSIL